MLFLPLVKADAEQRLVYARAAAEEIDRTREIMDYASGRPQFEAWSNKFRDATLGKSLGNIRAMHNPQHLAGVVKEINYDDGAKTVDVCFKVLDPVDWHKLEEGGYTGLSIGGGYLKKWTDPGDATVTRYTPRIAEISLVDSPCIPSARIMQLQKQDGTTAEVLLKGAPRTFAELRPPPSFADLHKAARATRAEAAGGAIGGMAGMGAGMAALTPVIGPGAALFPSVLSAAAGGHIGERIGRQFKNSPRFKTEREEHKFRRHASLASLPLLGAGVAGGIALHNRRFHRRLDRVFGPSRVPKPKSDNAFRQASAASRRGAAFVARKTLGLRQRSTHFEPEIAARMKAKGVGGRYSSIAARALGRAARFARFAKQDAIIANLEKAAYDVSKHPREHDGKFASKTGERVGRFLGGAAGATGGLYLGLRHGERVAQQVGRGAGVLLGRFKDNRFGARAGLIPSAAAERAEMIGGRLGRAVGGRYGAIVGAGALGIGGFLAGSAVGAGGDRFGARRRAVRAGKLEQWRRLNAGVSIRPTNRKQVKRAIGHSITAAKQVRAHEIFLRSMLDKQDEIIGNLEKANFGEFAGRAGRVGRRAWSGVQAAIPHAKSAKDLIGLAGGVSGIAAGVTALRGRGEKRRRRAPGAIQQQAIQPAGTPTPRMMKASMSPAEREKVRQTLHEFKHGQLHSFRANLPKRKMPKVTNRKQAIAIALSQARRLGKGDHENAIEALASEPMGKGILGAMVGGYLGSKVGRAVASGVVARGITRRIFTGKPVTTHELMGHTIARAGRIGSAVGAAGGAATGLTIGSGIHRIREEKKPKIAKSDAATLVGNLEALDKARRA